MIEENDNKPVFSISLYENSEWYCHLFGGDDAYGLVWNPRKGDEPNWFWRKMQYLCFGNRWVKR